MAGVAGNRAQIPIDEGIDLCKEMLFQSGLLVGSSLGIYFADWDSFKGFASGAAGSLADVEQVLVADYLRARDSSGNLPAVATMHRRRSSVRRLFWCGRALHLVAAEHNPTADLPLPPRSYTADRPLVDDEVEDCRCASSGFQNQTRYKAIWALAEAGATPRELCRVVRDSIDLKGGELVLVQDKRLLDRIVPLTPWGIEALSRHLDTLPSRGDVGVVYQGPGCKDRAPTLSEPIRRILTWAGLGDEPDISSKSIRGWRGASVFAETGGSHAEVAHVLGVDLNEAARIIRDPEFG